MSQLTKNLRNTKFSPPEPDELQNSIETSLDVLLNVTDDLPVYPRPAEEYLILATKLDLLLKQLETTPNLHVTCSRLEEGFEANFRQKHLRLLKTFTTKKQTPLEWCSTQLLAKSEGEQHLKLIENYFRKFSTKLAFQKLLLALKSSMTEQNVVREIVEHDPKLISYRIMVELANLKTLDQQIAKVEAIFQELPTLGVEVLLNSVSNKARVSFPHQSALVLNALLYRLDHQDGSLALLLTKIADDDALANQFYELLAEDDIYDKFEHFIGAVIDRFRQTRVYIAAIKKWSTPNNPAQPNNLFAVVAFEDFLRFVYLFVRPKSPVRHIFRQNVFNEHKLGEVCLEIEMLFRNFD